MDVVNLSRIQFALTAGFHYLYPPISIGLSLVIVIVEGMYVKTKSPLYKRLSMFWTKIFALSFALGVATGLVQVFAFGNNWSKYSRFVGDVFGSALAAEGVFAFFLEAGFIGLMLFGWKRLKPGMHYASTICVAFGAHFSATWIVAANSWMQTPAGFEIIGTGDQARAVITNFWDMIFNPSFLDRLTHVLIGCWLTGAFMVVGISAYYFLKRCHLDCARVSMKVGMSLALIMILLQLVSADSSAQVVAEYQPIKLAAIEGVFDTESHTPMNLVGWVDSDTQQVHALQVPGLLSFLVHHNFEKPVAGLDQFPRDEWPNVSAVFQLYHLMIYMWGAMFLAVILGIFLWKRGSFEKAKWIHRYFLLSIFFPVIANQAGWFTAEMGRQPWIVYKMMRTVQGASVSISKEQVIGSLIMFSVIYCFMLALFIFLLIRKVQHGPEQGPSQEDAIYRDPYHTPLGD